MIEEIMFLGSDHSTNVYRKAYRLIAEFKPEVVTLEYSLYTGRAEFIYQSLADMFELGKFIISKEKEWNERFYSFIKNRFECRPDEGCVDFSEDELGEDFIGGTEFLAGIHFCEDKRIPLYYVDEFFPSKRILEANLTTLEGKDILIQNRVEDKIRKDINYYINKFIKEYRRKFPSSLNKMIGRRNRFMANIINRLHEKEEYKRFTHIGGNNHYMYNISIPLQELIPANKKTIIDLIGNYSNPPIITPS